ncbi:MAG TPA: phosphonate ABC transporter ATP-binding protein [Acidimicrobiales bacterium]|jgi:phosphonate transport system ATP-binding protein|nr:phosphonate ABC transporter ATP-binding protein [Acidimicrobiales bacterium]
MGVHPALSVRDLGHAYGGAPVLDGVSFDAGAGEVVAVIGPSGAGKTTLFRCATAVIRPRQGHIEVEGRDLSRLGPADLRRARQAMGLVYQHYNLVRRLSALDNVLVGRLAHVPTWRVLLRRVGSKERSLALECLERVGLAHLAGARSDTLSGGQQQRVAIARALAQRSRLILADEPVASLDPASAASVLATLRSVAAEEGIAVVCSLHQIDLVPGFADRVVALRGGRLVLDIPAGQLGPEHRATVYGADGLVQQ